MSISNDVSRGAEDLKKQARQTVQKVGEQLNEQANYLRDATASFRYNTQEYIENNPWQSVAIAAGIGFLLGVAITASSSRR